MIVLDLFCGLGGFSSVFRERGHRVIGVDIVPPCDIQADVGRLPFSTEFRPDVILASPPCDEFSRESMPWCRTGKVPSVDLVVAAKRAIDTLRPRWWVIENVRGAIRYLVPILGPVRERVGSRYLWGNFPLFFHAGHRSAQGKERLGPQIPNRKRMRSMIPRTISDGLCRVIEDAK